ncbi:FAD-dependent monooxygenase [Fodinicola feengrottensis]|uniref:FAD-dependent monooxygenase n=1 Tax=Fodinicola feengrottensis TaxID=435914 RepID=A0ABN2G5M7_9ACTN|nr:FAD-dependent monooxygenase [Fodinicola feengrottensis]
MPSTSTDVLIVGAGPAGLLLAGDLAAAGVRTTILERRDTESNLSRAFAVHARTLEVLDARGVADELIGMGQKLSALQLFGRTEVHLDQLPARFPYLLVTAQYNVEHVLLRRAVAAGAQLVRGAEVVALRQDADGVEVDVRSGETYRSRYLVGTDGVQSTIRQALGLPFPGRSAVRSMMLADVRLTEQPAALLAVNGNANGFVFIAPFGDGWYRVMAWNKHNQVPDSAPVDLAEVAAVTKQTHGTDYGMHDPRFLSRFHSDERQVPHYRIGRVFLAGDAAHVHSPAGGQGMNTGLQDAANLSWKLAAAVHGWAPDGLLDTYESERHPVGRAVLRTSGLLLRLARSTTVPQRLLRRALGTVIGLVPAIRNQVAQTVSAIGVHYAAARGADRLVGHRVPDLAVTGSDRRLYRTLGEGKFVLLTPGDSDVAAEWADRVVTAVPVRAPRPYILVRPDGYVAWAGIDARGLTAALESWCGTASQLSGAHS